MPWFSRILSNVSEINQPVEFMIWPRLGLWLARLFTPPHIFRRKFNARPLRRLWALILCSLLSSWAGADATIQEAGSVGCNHHALIPGTLLSNIDRILRDCDRLLGRWPLLEQGIYEDYLIRQKQRLPGAGDIESLFTFVKKEYGFMPTSGPYDVGAVVDFVAVE